ncbi:hypothetical protein BDZ94DRAFT_1269464, partial [Collybia nuda]
MHYPSPQILAMCTKSILGTTQVFWIRSMQPQPRKLDGMPSCILRTQSSAEIPGSSRFIPSYMTELAVRGRLVELMETDWKTKAAILLAERQQQPGSY